jgi:prepilin-type N-terminal cleavage/methylation domain-containing protein
MFTELRRHSRNSRSGFTLSEMSVAIAVSSVILTALLSFTVYAAKSFVAVENYVDLEQKSQNALDTMTRDIRETQCLTNYTTRVLSSGQTVTNSLVFADFDGQPLTFAFTNNTLMRLKGTERTMLLTNVDYLTFQVFQRNPVAGQWEQYPAGDIATCKLISVSWICSRSILGSRMNTESVQTAKIVIRKE